METNLKTPKRTRIGALLALAVLLGGGIVVVAAAPAAAHYCEAENPAASCGHCLSGNHNHVYTNGATYCRSRDLIAQ